MTKFSGYPQNAQQMRKRYKDILKRKKTFDMRVYFFPTGCAGNIPQQEESQNDAGSEKNNELIFKT